MRTIPSKYKPSDPELKEYARMLRQACQDLKSAQAMSLEYAVYAGKVVTEIKKHLKTSTTLLRFKKFLEMYCPELKQRSTNTYQQVYKQVSRNSKTSYSSISEVLKDWRKDHPNRSRFMAMAEKSKKMLSDVPTPELPDPQKVEPIGMLRWLAPTPGQLYIVTGDLSYTVQKVEKCNKDSPQIYEFYSDPVPLKRNEKVRIEADLEQNGQTICQVVVCREQRFFRIATDQCSKYFTPEEEVAPVPPQILPDDVRAVLRVLASARDLPQEQQKELRLWLRKYIELFCR